MLPINAFENTYLNTEPKTSATSGKTKKETVKKKRKKGKKRKGKKKKSKEEKKKLRNQATQKKHKDSPTPSSAPVNIGKQKGARNQIKSNKKCNSSTKDLLLFDVFSQQLLKCNGVEWQVWSPVSNSDESSHSRLCQPGWNEYDGRCYRFINDRLSWDDAEKLCYSSYKGHISSVQSMKHLRWLGEQAGKKSFWIGLNDKWETGVWKFISGDVVTFTNWKGGRPRVKRMLHKKNCVVVKKRYKWRNKHCDKYRAKFICELSAKGQFWQQSKKRPRKGPSRRHVRRNKKEHTGAFFFG